MGSLPFLLGPDVIKPRPTTMSLIQDCGYCIRDLALAIRAPRTVLQDREKALSAIEDVKNLIRIINNAHQASTEKTFHQLFIVRRIGDVALCESDCYTVDVKSQGVLASLMQVHRRLDVLSARRIFTACRSSLESSFLAAWAFEHIAHHYLASGCRTTCLEMTAFKGGSRFFHSAWDIIAEEFVVSSSSVRVEALNDQQECISCSKEKYELALPKRRINHYDYDELSSRVLESEYYVPTKKHNNCLFDAFFVSRGIMEKPVLWVVQTTMAARLGGGSAQDGYVSMETIRERLGDDCSVKYVLVVPLHRNRAYRWEMPDGWNDHEGQVFIQYINMDTES